MIDVAMDVYPCDETWEFVNLTLQYAVSPLSERKASMCSEV